MEKLTFSCQNEEKNATCEYEDRRTAESYKIADVKNDEKDKDVSVERMAYLDEPVGEKTRNRDQRCHFGGQLLVKNLRSEPVSSLCCSPCCSSMGKFDNYYLVYLGRKKSEKILESPPLILL